MKQRPDNEELFNLDLKEDLESILKSQNLKMLKHFEVWLKVHVGLQ